MILSIDVLNRSLISAFPKIFLNDILDLDLYFYDHNPADDSIIGVRYAAATIRAGLTLPLSPTSGTFKITFGANTTAALAYNITAADLQTALQGLASIGSGNISVTGDYQAGFLLEFIGALAGANESAITATATSLYPIATATIKTLRGGAAGINELQFLRFTSQVVPLATSWSEIVPTSTEITVEDAGSYGGAAGYAGRTAVTLTFGSVPTGGTFKITFTITLAPGRSSVLYAVIPALATAAQIQALLRANIAPNIIVTGQGGYSITITASFVADVAVDSSGLSWLYGYRGSLNLTDGALDNLLGKNDSASPFIEVELTPSGGTAQTVLHTSVTLYADFLK